MLKSDKKGAVKRQREGVLTLDYLGTNIGFKSAIYFQSSSFSLFFLLSFTLSVYRWIAREYMCVCKRARDCVSLFHFLILTASAIPNRIIDRHAKNWLVSFCRTHKMNKWFFAIFLLAILASIHHNQLGISISIVYMLQLLLQFSLYLIARTKNHLFTIRLIDFKLEYLIISSSDIRINIHQSHCLVHSVESILKFGFCLILMATT